MHAMQVMDPTGHTTVNWTQGNEADEDVARTTFITMISRGYNAFRVDPDGGPSVRMKDFDPAAEKMILIPQLVGG